MSFDANTSCGSSIFSTLEVVNFRVLREMDSHVDYRLKCSDTIFLDPQYVRPLEFGVALEKCIKFPGLHAVESFPVSDNRYTFAFECRYPIHRPTWPTLDASERLLDSYRFRYLSDLSADLHVGSEQNLWLVQNAGWTEFLMVLEAMNQRANYALAFTPTTPTGGVGATKLRLLRND